MPIMDGFEASKAIRKEEEGRKVDKCLIVALTAYDTDAFRKKALEESGMDRFLTKPINFETINELLMDVIK